MRSSSSTSRKDRQLEPKAKRSPLAISSAAPRVCICPPVSSVRAGVFARPRVVATVPLWLVTSRLEPRTGSTGPEDTAPAARRVDVAAGAGPRRRRPDIQGLRAVAVLLVVAYHAGVPVRGGFVGVDVFFVISGFVIAGMLLRQAGPGGRVRFGEFYLRRARRLRARDAPDVAGHAGVVAVLYSPVGPDQGAAAKAGIAATFLSANAYFFASTGGYFQPDASSNPFLHTLVPLRRGAVLPRVPGRSSRCRSCLGRRLDAHPGPPRDAALLLPRRRAASLLLCVALAPRTGSTSSTSPAGSLHRRRDSPASRSRHPGTRPGSSWPAGSWRSWLHDPRRQSPGGESHRRAAGRRLRCSPFATGAGTPGYPRRRTRAGDGPPAAWRLLPSALTLSTRR